MSINWKLSIAAAALAMTTAVPSVLACDGKDKAKDAKQEQKVPAVRVASATFRVEGMHCEGCGDKVRASLTAKGGIIKVDVKQVDKRITVEYDSDKWTPAQIAKVISELGYKATAEA